jgi:hypothetical protein
VPQDVLDDLHDRMQPISWPVVIAGQNYGGPELANRKELAKKALRFNGRKKNQSLTSCRTLRPKSMGKRFISSM